MFCNMSNRNGDFFMALSKKLRFEVFKRDSFTCQYCGSHPPSAVLEADHVHPQSKGGNDDINNLITACFECNRGKSNIELSSVPASVKQNLKEIKEKELQIQEYNKFLEGINKRIERLIRKLSNIYTRYFPGYKLAPYFINGTIKLFLEKLPGQTLLDAMNLACSKVNHNEQSIKYFCGICWCKIRERKI